MSEPENPAPAKTEATASGGGAVAQGGVAAASGGIAIGRDVFGPVTVNYLGKTPPPAEVPQRINSTRLTHFADKLFGRETELANLEAAWSDPKIHVVTVVAWGGVGKTSLVAQWAANFAARDYDGADYFDWSFYSQGTREMGAASGETFIAAGLRFFGGEEGERLAESPRSAEDKGARLAGFMAKRKALLILDGLEPLQYPPFSPLAGQLKDPGVRTLLKGLAQRNPGLCVVTTREKVTDLASFVGGTAPEWSLERLSTVAGVALLEKLQVRGATKELERLANDVNGHALTLSLIGTFLAKAHGGDVRRRDRVDLHKASKVQGGHAFRVIAAYERWFISEGEEESGRQLAVLRLLGLFDRPADDGCLEALRKDPAIPGLTDQLIGLDEEDWNLTLSALDGLVTLSTACSGKSLDAHPLIREYFARQLRVHYPEAWRAAHGRLFEHLRDTTKQYQPDTLEGLQPLYQAIAHGCYAGRQQTAFDVYQDRIARGKENFSTVKLGAIGADLGALACFFDPPWHQASRALADSDRALLMNEAAFRLRALGRLTEALKPMRLGMEMRIAQKIWDSASRIASNLSELEQTMGDIPSAVRTAAKSVSLADRSEHAFYWMLCRTTHADALHQAGRRSEALALFCEAERMQAERQPSLPLIYAVAGFLYCDLLLAEIERAAERRNWAEVDTAAFSGLTREVEARASHTLEWVGQTQSLLDIALDHLTLGRAALYRSILEGTDLAPARAEIEMALDGIRRAGYSDELPRGLLTRAWLFHLEGDTATARADLDEAQEIAERGPMPLFLADIALMRARLFGEREALAEARRLIEKHGYGRRMGELEDLEAELA